MRIIALSFLAALCTIEAIPASTDLEIWRFQVRELQWNAETITRQLQLLRDQIMDDTIRAVSDKWDAEKDSFRSYKYLLLSEIQKETNAAGAFSCYNNAVCNINRNEDIAKCEAAICKAIAQRSIYRSLGLFDTLISTGEEISLELDNVFLNCHDGDIVKMQSCIIGKLAEIRGNLMTLESDRISAEITAGPLSNNVIMAASNCLKKAYSSAYSAEVGIRKEVTACIGRLKT